jgi:hypothetical protein
MLSKDHIHSWVRLKTTAKGVYFKCNHPECFSTQERRMIEGKLNLCPKCMRNTFILTKEDLRRAKPLCPKDCSNSKKAIQDRSLNQGVSGALDLLFKIPELPRETSIDD